MSVVVPVYNVEDYLRECVESVLTQDYPSLEIVLVDDGSTDSCPSICDEFEAKHANISTIHQANRGLSDARNTGLDASSGDYITFIDSDDWVESDMISSLMRGMLASGSEVGVTGFANCYEDESRKRISRSGRSSVLSRTEGLSSYLFSDQVGVCVWGKIWLRDLWSDVRCPVGKLYEDQYTTYKLLMKTDLVYFDPEPRYNYRQRSNSIGHTVDESRIIDLYDGAIEQYEVISNAYPDIEQSIAVGSLFWRVVFINYLIKGGLIDKERTRATQRFGRERLSAVLGCRYLNMTRKGQLLLLILSFPVYRFIYRRLCVRNF